MDENHMDRVGGAWEVGRRAIGVIPKFRNYIYLPVGLSKMFFEVKDQARTDKTSELKLMSIFASKVYKNRHLCAPSLRLINHH